MDRDFLIRLTNNVYQLTLLFPKKEPLRYRMRELADEILVNFIKIKNHSNPSPKAIDSIDPVREYNILSQPNANVQQFSNGVDRILDDLEIIDSFFAIADVQSWVGSAKLLPAWDDYSKLKKYIKELNKKSSICSPPAIIPKEEKSLEIVTLKIDDGEIKKEPIVKTSPRHEKIVDFLKNNGKAQVGEFKKIFPEVTKRTLRRDFRQLLKDGKIERIGERNDTYYQVIGRT